MLLSRENLKAVVRHVLHQRLRQGADLDEASWTSRLEAAAASYDALPAIAQELRTPPLRALRRAGLATGE